MKKMKLETPDLTAQNIEKIGALFPNCVTETVDENGKPLNDKFEHRRSKQITRELEQKVQPAPGQNERERAERPELKKVDYAAGDVKHQSRQHRESGLAMATASSRSGSTRLCLPLTTCAPRKSKAR